MFFYCLPLNQEDNTPEIKINSIQKKSIEVFLSKVKSGELNYRYNKCMCGNEDKVLDVLITQQDRYGIPSKNVLCKKCSLIRQDKILDDNSTYVFYTEHYRSIYVGSSVSTNDFFKDQFKRGEIFLGLVDKKIGLENIKNVFEVGAGAGGILWPFFKAGKLVSGCDYGEKYLQYGIEKGISLYSGGLDKNKTTQKSQDLLIISHVLEHLNNPIIELNNFIDVVREGGYLLIEVPGSLSAAKTYVNPVLYFQNAHVNNFNGSFLNLLFAHLGLEVVYGDENCTFLLKKPKGWKVNTKPFFVDNKSSIIAEKVERYFRLHGLLFRAKVSPYLYRRILISLLRNLRLKTFFKRFFARL